MATVSFCPERCPSGEYAGFVCCSEADHLSDHTITSGKPEGGSIIVHTWPRVRSSTVSFYCGCGKEATIPFMGGMFCNWCAP